MKRPKIVAIAIIISILSILTIQVAYTGDLGYFWQRNNWSIGIYSGSSPFSLSDSPNIVNPVLTANDVNDINAKFVADPFIIKKDGFWYMFFEVWNLDTNQGDIGLASSNDGIKWTYERIILDESFHLSYPYLFNINNTYYIIPESTKANSVRLYKSTNFPYDWSYEKTLFEGYHADPSVFHYDKWWFMFTETSPRKYDTLRLFFADDLDGQWYEHPKSPIIDGDPNSARPGGRILMLDNKLYRFAQDAEPTYGNAVRAFEINNISDTEYDESEIPENPILKSGDSGWNEKGMHHVDAHKINDGFWIASVDGLGPDIFFSSKN